MPEYIRSLIVILVLASIVFALAKAPATAFAMSTEDYVRRRNTWFLITLAGFLSQSFWIFSIATVIIISVSAKTEKNKVALWCFLILAIPLVKVEIPGFAGIRYLIEIDYLRILTAILLIPLVVGYRRKSVVEKHPTLAPDIILAIYVIYNVVLTSRVGDIVAISRTGIGWLIDVVIPYYAISRYVKNLNRFRDLIMSLTVVGMISASVAVFEFSRGWMLYDSFGEALSLDWTTGYLVRGKFVRAVSSSGIAIVLGYVLALVIILYLYLYKIIHAKAIYLIGLALLIAGAVAPLSKGPWIGMVTAIIIFFAMGPSATKNIMTLVLIGLPVGLLAMVTDTGSKIVDYLPFIGGVDEANTSYRTNLLRVSINAFSDNPFFGSAYFMTLMEEARNGEGLIDLVNHYVGVALYSGLFGLSLFAGFFITILYQLFNKLRIFENKSEEHALGRSLFAALCSALIMISSASSINHVPIFYYMLAGLSVGYINMHNSRNTEFTTRVNSR